MSGIKYKLSLTGICKVAVLIKILAGCSNVSRVQFRESASPELNSAESEEQIESDEGSEELEQNPNPSPTPTPSSAANVTSTPAPSNSSVPPAPTPTPTPTLPPVVSLRSCADVKSHSEVPTDGEYTIDIDGDSGTKVPFKVYCAGMQTATPLEYLSLLKTKANGHSQLNYSKSATGGTCTATADYYLYVEKVRFNLTSLEVDITDKTFTSDSGNKASHASCPGYPATYWGSVHNCKASYDASSVSVIDLSGLPFKIATTQQWSDNWRPSQSYRPGGTATVASDRKSATITGGGYCGGRSPIDNKIKLIFD